MPAFTPGQGNAVSILLPSGETIEGYLDGAVSISVRNKYETIFEGGIGSLLTSIAKMAAQFSAFQQIFSGAPPQYIDTRLVVFNSPLLYAGTEPIGLSFKMWIVGKEPNFAPAQYVSNFDLLKIYVSLLKAASPSSADVVTFGVVGPQAITVIIGAVVLQEVLIQSVSTTYGDPPVYDVAGKPLVGQVELQLSAQRVYAKEDIEKLFGGGQ